jgi:uncharacterized membrane protein YeaQ/YmgE (transglycosylase-associated protein family)
MLRARNRTHYLLIFLSSDTAPQGQSKRPADSCGIWTGIRMTLSDRSLLVILIVGIVAGWLAGKVVRGAGFGLIGDAALGIVGGLTAEWFARRFGLHIWHGIIGLALTAAIGAIVILTVLRALGAGSWGTR